MEGNYKYLIELVFSVINQAQFTQAAKQSVESAKAIEAAMAGLGKGKAAKGIEVPQEKLEGLMASLSGSEKIFSKVTETINQAGQQIGSSLTERFKDASGNISEVATTYGKSGEKIKTTFTAIDSEAAKSKVGIESFTSSLAGFDKIVSATVTTTDKLGNIVGKQVTERFRNSSGAIKEVTTSFDNQNKITKSITRDISKAADGMGIFEKAIRRVLIVAPIWMIFRTAMMSFFRAFSEGLKYMEDFDRAMIKAQAVIHGTTGDMATTVTDLKNRIRDLSQSTGESMTNIAAAFYKFGTVGIEFESAWAGAESSVKIAMATMGDAAQMSKALALSFKLLGDTVDKNLPINKAYESQMAKLFRLWQINAFEADEFTSSLQNFLPTANTMGITMDETNALLATLGSAAIQGARGGRLLRTSFSKLLERTNELATSLGIYVNPELENSFSLFMKVLKVIKEMSGQQVLPIAAQEVIRDIFGGVRGGEPIRGLVALYDELNQNLKITTGGFLEQKKILEDYNQRVEDVKNSVHGQLKIFRELRTQVFEQFITGTLGTDDFAKALQKVNILMEELSNRALKLGQLIHEIGTHPIGLSSLLGFGAGREWLNELQNIAPRIQAAFEGKLPLKEVIELSTEIKMKYPKDTEFQAVASRLDELAKGIAIKAGESARFQERFAKIVLDYDEKHFKNLRDQVIEEELVFDIKNDILKRIDLQKRSMKEQLAIIKLQKEGYSESDIAIAEIGVEVSKIVDSYNQMDKIIDGTVPPLQKQTLLSAVLSENWEKVLKSLTGMPDPQEKILSLAKQVNQIELEKQKILSQQKNTLEDLVLQYEKANTLDRTRLKRLMELIQMTPEQVKIAFEGNFKDREIIIDNIDKFSKAVQDFVTTSIAKEYTLPVKHPDIIYREMLDELLSKLRPTIPVAPVPTAQNQQNVNITNKGAEVINVAIYPTGMRSEEAAEIAAENLKRELLNDEDFKKGFLRNAGNYIQSK